MSDIVSLSRARLRQLKLWFILCASGLTACAPPSSTAPGAGGIRVLGSRGSQPGRFSYPRGIDALPDGRMAVADKTGRIQILSADAQVLAHWRLPRYDNGTPTGIVFDRTDPATTTLIVADTHNSRILRYSFAGELLVQFGEYGDQPGTMIYPTDVAVDPAGNLYVTEYGANDRVMKFTSEGGFMEQWGSFGTGPGEFQRPMAVVWWPPDRLIVADSCNHRLQVLSADGRLLHVWGETGDAPAQFNYPYDLAVDSSDRIYVVEYGNNRLQVLDAEGQTLTVFGGPGARPGEFGTPWGIAPGSDETVIVADTHNHRLQLVERDLILLGSVP